MSVLDNRALTVNTEAKGHGLKAKKSHTRPLAYLGKVGVAKHGRDDQSSGASLSVHHLFAKRVSCVWFACSAGTLLEKKERSS